MKAIKILLLVLLFSNLSYSQTWKKIESNTSLRLNDISFGSEQVGYIGADNETVLKTIDGGETWNVIRIDSSLIGFPKDVVDLDFQSATHGYIVMNYSQNPSYSITEIYFTKDGGNTWKPSSAMMCGVVGCYMQDTANGYFFGSSCFGGFTIDKVVNRVAQNSTYLTYSNYFINDMDFNNNNYGIAVGDLGQVFRTTNAGAKWDTLSTSFSQTINAVQFFNDSVVFVAIDSLNNSIFYSTDSGQIWQPHLNSTTFYYPIIQSIAVAPDKTVYGVGKSTISSKDPVIIWGSETGFWNSFVVNKPNSGFNSVTMSDSVRAFAVGDSGMIYTNKGFSTTISEKQMSYNLEVFPNPANGFMYVKSEKMKRIQLYSLDGKMILEQPTNLEFYTSLDCSDLIDGVFLLKITHSDNTVQFRKILVH